MNTYMGYIAEEENMPDDHPSIGIILARGKDELKRLVDNIMKEENEEYNLLGFTESCYTETDETAGKIGITQ